MSNQVSNMKYSIIIPHFNSISLLVSLLKTIPSRPDLEVIIVDDRSDDFDLVTSSVKKITMENEVILVTNNGEKGAGAARNVGLNLAKGEWIIFADSDDLFTEDAFDIIDNELNYISNSIDIIYFNPTSHNLIDGCISNRHKRISKLVSNHVNDNSITNEVRLKYTQYVPWSKVIRKKLIDSNSIKFDETLIANDGMFSAKSARASNGIISSNKVIYSVSFNPLSLTKKKNEELLYVRVSVFCDFYSFLKESEREIINVSPIPLIIYSAKYGISPMIKVIRTFQKSNISFFKYIDMQGIISRFKLKVSL